MYAKLLWGRVRHNLSLKFYWKPNTGGKHGKERKMTYLKRILDDTQREKKRLVDDARDRAEWRKFVK